MREMSVSMNPATMTCEVEVTTQPNVYKGMKTRDPRIMRCRRRSTYPSRRNLLQATPPAITNCLGVSGVSKGPHFCRVYSRSTDEHVSSDFKWRELAGDEDDFSLSVVFSVISDSEAVFDMLRA